MPVQVRALRRGVSVAALLFAGVGLAYVMPSTSILRRLVERRDDLHLSTLQVHGTAIFQGETAKQVAAAVSSTAEGELQADVTFSFKLPGRYRVDVRSPQGAEASWSVGGRGKNAQEVEAVRAGLEELCALLAFRSTQEGEARADLERHLHRRGVDVGPVNLSRLGGQIAYVLGRSDHSQLWVYKDTFLPARLRSVSKDGAGWDVELLGYGSPIAGDWFPRSVEVYRGSELAFRFTLQDANGHPSFPSDYL